MLGIDEALAALADGSSAGAVLVVAALLGLRHATDPDHLAAVASLVAVDERSTPRDARALGLAWGAGHALSLLALGTPIVVFGGVLPGELVAGAEVVVGVVIMLLSARVFVHWRLGYWHVHEHRHATGERHVHLHAHAAGRHDHVHAHAERPLRTPVGAFAVGLVHGVGGSAGLGVVLLAAVDVLPLALGALVFFAAFTAVSMTLLSGGVGWALAAVGRRGLAGLAMPVLATVSFAFGGYYGLSAL